MISDSRLTLSLSLSLLPLPPPLSEAESIPSLLTVWAPHLSVAARVCEGEDAGTVWSTERHHTDDALLSPFFFFF